MKQIIKDKILGLGADVCGIGNIKRFNNAPEGFAPTDIFSECQSVISFGVALPKGLFKIEPRLVYSHFNAEVCNQVDFIALAAAKWIEDTYKCNCVPVPCDAPNEYWESDTMTAKGLISMKHTAVACGLGGIGRSSLFLSPKYGNRLTLGAILTNMDLESDPMCENICIKGCRKCVDACPVQAIRDGSVIQKLCRTNTYGKTARGFDTVDCNKCRSICPMINGKPQI